MRKQPTAAEEHNVDERNPHVENVFFATVTLAMTCVLWVNLGMHHLTRAEDQPVMPTVWHSFKLRR